MSTKLIIINATVGCLTLPLSPYLILNHQVLRLLRLFLLDRLLQSPLLHLHPIIHHILNLKCHQLRNVVFPEKLMLVYEKFSSVGMTDHDKYQYVLIL